jgi:hypothetical protein
MFNIVCYTGGACGDLITALIDSSDVVLNNNVVHLPAERSKFKKPFLFNNELEKNLYLVEMKKRYRSIPSHDIEYHKDNSHDFIGITVTDYNLAVWAAQRFKKLHRDHVWEEMTKSCGANSVSDYAQILIDYSKMSEKFTNRIVRLEDIVNGNAIKSLSSFNIKVSDEAAKFYDTWRSNQKGS